MRKQSIAKQSALIGFAVLVLSLPAFSQSCALCYTQAASAGRRMIEALRGGIIVLMIPPAGMSVGMSILAYRRRNRFKRDDDENHGNADDQW